jgi:hypothetical protein
LIPAFFCLLLGVQQSFDSRAAYQHEAKRYRHAIPSAGISSGSFNQQLRLTLTVSPTGAVVEAHTDNKSELLKYWPDIEPEVRRWQFKPFEVDGKAVTAEVEEWVELVPPERLPTHHVAAPALRPNSEIIITLERTQCYGSCPAYKVSISTKGIVFEGYYHIRAKGISKDRVDPDQVRKLAQRFISADFYSMDDVYHQSVTDNPTYKLSISIDGHAKQVVDYVGYQVGMPVMITDLENAVDTLAHTERWIK